MRILLCGMIAGVPGQGGAAWAVLQYLLGLRKLGHDVFFLEPVSSEALLPAGASLASSRNAAYFRGVVRDFGLEGGAALLGNGSRQALGADYAAIERMADDCDLLLNLSGTLRDSNLIQRPRRRAYVDLDPGYTQLWREAEGLDMGLAGHDRFVTVGLRLGRPECPIPLCGRRWIPTLQPVVVEHWPELPEVPGGAYSTVGNWRGYGSIEWGGVHFGQKAHSFRRFLQLPSRVSVKLDMALAVDPGETGDLKALAEHGWTLLDPSRVAGTPDRYRRFIQSSRAELGIAKSGYVKANCGWFSDRGACYLATGRPVLAQETGFSGILPTGEGLLGFADLDGLVKAVEAVESDYRLHSRRAAEIAREYFDSRRVLSKLLEELEP